MSEDPRAAVTDLARLKELIELAEQGKIILHLDGAICVDGEEQIAGVNGFAIENLPPVPEPNEQQRLRELLGLLTSRFATGDHGAPWIQELFQQADLEAPHAKAFFAYLSRTAGKGTFVSQDQMLAFLQQTLADWLLTGIPDWQPFEQFRRQAPGVERFTEQLERFLYFLCQLVPFVLQQEGHCGTVIGDLPETMAAALPFHNYTLDNGTPCSLLVGDALGAMLATHNLLRFLPPSYLAAPDYMQWTGHPPHVANQPAPVSPLPAPAPAEQLKLGYYSEREKHLLTFTLTEAPLQPGQTVEAMTDAYEIFTCLTGRSTQPPMCFFGRAAVSELDEAGKVAVTLTFGLRLRDGFPDLGGLSAFAAFFTFFTGFNYDSPSEHSYNLVVFSADSPEGWYVREQTIEAVDPAHLGRFQHLSAWLQHYQIAVPNLPTYTKTPGFAALQGPLQTTTTPKAIAQEA